MVVNTDIKKCCKDTVNQKHPQATYFTTPPNIRPSNQGCFYSNSNNKIIYNEIGRPARVTVGSTGHQNSHWTQVNIDDCLAKKIDEEEVLKSKDYLADSRLITSKENQISKLEIENKKRLYTGLGIGGIFTLFACILIFVTAKLKLIPLFYNRIIELLEEDRPLLIGIVVITLIVLSIFSYLVFVVYGGAGKKTIIGGTLELNNLMKHTIKPSVKHETPYVFEQHSFDYNETNVKTDSDNQASYIFWLRINEKNKIYSDDGGFQHIFHVGEDGSNLQFPGVWFDPKKNIMSITLSKYKKGKIQNEIFDIEIDNIDFGKWYHFGIVIHNMKTSGSYVEIYINSKLVVSKLLESGYNFITKTEMADIKPKVYVGGWGGYTIEGSINNLFNYNYPLTHKQIESHYLSLVVVTQGYFRYIFNILGKIILYPKHLLFSSGDDDGICPK